MSIKIIIVQYSIRVCTCDGGWDDHSKRILQSSCMAIHSAPELSMFKHAHMHRAGPHASALHVACTFTPKVIGFAPCLLLPWICMFL